MNTPLCALLGIQKPIVQAPMGGGIGPEMTAAVSNAGGLGTLPLWSGDVDNLRRNIREIRSLTSKPFAINLNIAFLESERLDACLDEGVKIISLFWGDPSPWVDRAKSAGAVVLHTVGAAADARRSVDLGVDVVVAQGWEAGGHVCGTVGSMALIPSVVDAVGSTPVIAAGGIADGRGMAAALALGASGVWIGTRFLASKEARIHPHYQTRLLRASEDDTAHFADLFDVGWPAAPHRVLRNSTTEAWRAAGGPASGVRPGEGDVVARSATGKDIARYSSHTPREDDAGDIEALPMWAGQGLAMINDIEPAATILNRINDEAEAVLQRLAVPS